jgi:hypothetical protein
MGPFPVSGGAVTLTICDRTNSNCCTTITVNPPPSCATVCDNIINAGVIGSDQSNCGPYDPATIALTSPPVGGTGALEYMWLSSTSGCPTSAAQAIPGATGPTYDPPYITQTTWYRLCVRRAGCTQWFETNCVVKQVLSGCQVTCPLQICVAPYTIELKGINANTTVEIRRMSDNALIYSCNYGCPNPVLLYNVAPGYYYVKAFQYAYQGGPLNCKIDGYYGVPVSAKANVNSAARWKTVPVEALPMKPSISDAVPVDIRNAEPEDVSPEVSVNFEMTIYPNPASEFATVTWEGIEHGKQVEIQLLNELGQKVTNIRIDDAAIGKAQLELSTYRSGSYLVMLKQEGEAPIVKKLLIVR